MRSRKYLLYILIAVTFPLALLAQTPRTATMGKDFNLTVIRWAPAIKRLENGRIIIERYGRKYDMLGQ